MCFWEMKATQKKLRDGVKGAGVRDEEHTLEEESRRAAVQPMKTSKWVKSRSTHEKVLMEVKTTTKGNRNKRSLAFPEPVEEQMFPALPFGTIQWYTVIAGD